MLKSRVKRTGRISVFAAAVLALAVALSTFDSIGSTAEAASLKHIDEIVAESGTFNILELVPDPAAASIGYYIDGQEPSSGWKTAIAGLTSPADRSSYVNTLFKRLADPKNLYGGQPDPVRAVLSNGTTSALKYTYYDTNNHSYYTEAYTATDPQNWSKLHLNAAESVNLTGTMSPQANGPYRANYTYSPQAGGGYIQNIDHFVFSAAPTYGSGTYYYTPVFTKITVGGDLSTILNSPVYMKDTATGVYSTSMTVQDKLDLGGFSASDPVKYYYVDPAQPGVYTPITSGMDFTGKLGFVVYTKDAATGAYVTKITVGERAKAGGFDTAKEYFVVSPGQTGAPGNFNYAAVVSTADADDAPGDGYTTPAQGGSSYFARNNSSFTYVGTGGNYTYSASGSTVYQVRYNDVFYKAGYVNNNLFKTLIFGLDSSHLNALNITVTVKKASDVTAGDISAASLIYISTGTDATQNGANTTYSVDSDIAEARAAEIYDFASNKNPVIVDYAIVSDQTRGTSPTALKIKRLGLICLQSSLTLPIPSLSGMTSGNWDTVWANLAYMTADKDRTFVNNNVYCFDSFNDQTLNDQTPSADNITRLVTPLYADAFSQTVTASGFSAVLTEIQNENFLRTLAGQQTLLPENVSVANSVRHIINYMGRRSSNQKTAITVLDLEPAKVTTGLTADTVRGWINNTLAANQIKIIHMTTGEFVGKIGDLNETYDMIYLGMFTDSLNTSNGNTVYNDTSMNGLIYSNIGDKYYGNIELAGIRSQDYVQNYLYNNKKPINNVYGTNANLFRFSGNDITKTAVTNLQKFAQAGYPVILADGFVSGSSINTAKVDNSSYMYQAVSGIFGTYTNVMAQTYAAGHDETVIQYMNVSKPSLNLTASPASYTTNPNTTLTADPNDGHYYLSYTFTIGNVTDPTPITTTYDCRLFIDLNADGRYTDNEELQDIVVHRQSDGALILPLKDSGDNEYYALTADVPYQVTRQMPDEYVGIIPWNLKVTKNGADQIHASASGFTRIAAGSNRQQINILQIMQPGTETQKLNLHTQMTDPQGIYGTLIRNLQDFTVNIDEIPADVLETKGATAADIKTWLDSKGLTGVKGYDMLIIGFNDCYNGIGPNSATAIVNYIGSGKSVLFTHDTTSLTQVDMSGVSNYPMVTNYTQPNITTLTATNVLQNTSTLDYRSIDGKIYWNGAYIASPPPPYIRQNGNSGFVVLMTSDVSSGNEADYWAARAGTSKNYQIYNMGTNTQLTTTVTSTTTLANFRASNPNSTIIYVYCGATSGWYGTNGNVSLFDLTATSNFTKFINSTRYVCSGITYNYKSSAGVQRPLNYASTLTTTDYVQIEKCLYNSTANGYTVVGKYMPTTSPPTYTLISTGSTTWYPATGAPFPQATLYDRDPATLYTVGNFPNGITDWGYYFNTVIRDAVGLDRYGITNPLLKSIVDVSQSMSYQDVQTVLNNNRSVAFAPKNGGTATVNEYQGYTNYALIRFAGSGNSYRYTSNNYSNRETTNVSQVNKGQITTYPYNVNTLAFGGNDATITGYGGSYMKIGLTHEQYFQINMNTDDIVVWYCMSNYSGITNGVISYDDNSYYDDVPNDCVNAYYIYNKGNVTYSGVGHTSDASLYTGSGVGQQYVNEAKLFVNTMIAAYRSAQQAPTVKIKKDAHGTADASQKYVVYDEQIGSASPTSPDAAYSPVLEESLPANDESRAVYFRIYDPNVGVAKTVTLGIYVSDPVNGTVDPTIDGTAKLSLLTTTSAQIYNTDETPVTTPKGGYVYKFYLPNSDGAVPVLDQLKSSGTYSIRVYVKVTTTISGNSRWSTASMDIKKQQLFPLA